METNGINQDLEERVSNTSKYSNVVSTIKKEVRGYLADTTSVLLFGNVVYGANEFFIGGLEPDELLKTRLGMSAFNLIFSRPYGKVREYWAKLLKADADSSRLKKFITDTSSNIVFYSPIYASMMWMADASPNEIITTTLSGIAISSVAARPMGWFMDKTRKLFKVKPTLESYVEKKDNYEKI